MRAPLSFDSTHDDHDTSKVLDFRLCDTYIVLVYTCEENFIFLILVFLLIFFHLNLEL